MERSSHVEYVIVGGGIAGASLATALARADKSVLVLEATEYFKDRVRGESMMPWGVAEARELGVADLLIAAGAHVAPQWHRYSEHTSEPRIIPVGSLVPGVGGTLNLEHRVACQTLLDAAADAGAIVERGVRDVAVTPGSRPQIEYANGGQRLRATARVVIGADGRGSTVRRGIHVPLAREEATGYVAGLLLDGVAGPDDRDVVYEHERGMSLLLAQGDGRARCYHCVPTEHRTRYAGVAGSQRFLEDARTEPSPIAERLVHARAAGPCAAVAGVDTWTDRPFSDGAVLVGDAAGYGDPTAGCGLSNAMRDVRLVRDLLLDGAATADDFAGYGAERSERMRRLRLLANILVAASVEDAPNRAARRKLFAEAVASMDPGFFPVIVSMFAGPETAPREAFSDGLAARLRAA